MRAIALALTVAGLAFFCPAIGGAVETLHLKSLTFSPSSIDTVKADAVVTLNFAAADDVSGINSFEATFTDPSGTSCQSATARFQPALSSAHSVRVRFPRFAAPGAWVLSSLFLTDTAGETLILDQDDLRRLGFATNLEVVSVRDTVSPRLSALTYTPKIDTRSASADVQATYSAIDDLSGLAYLEAAFLSPSGNVTRTGTVKAEGGQILPGALTIAFPRLSEPGAWTLHSVFLADAAGNTLVLDEAGLAELGVKTTLEVESAIDTIAPELMTLRFKPDSIDTRERAAAVDVEFTASDDITGVRSFEVTFVNLSGTVMQRAAKILAPASKVTDTVTASARPQTLCASISTTECATRN